MQIIIDIEDKAYNEILKHNVPYNALRLNMIIRSGVSLPKNHKRLIEANEDLFQQIRDYAGKNKAFEILNNAPTIVPESINNKDID